MNASYIYKLKVNIYACDNYTITLHAHIRHALKYTPSIVCYKYIIFVFMSLFILDGFYCV